MSDEPLRAPFTYNLTEMVGRRANDGRTMVVMTFEVDKRHFVVGGIAAIPALLVSLVAATLIGYYAIAIFVAIIAAALWLFTSTTREGLQVKQWQALNDRRTSTVGRLFLCGREVDPTAVEILNVVSGTVPMPVAGNTWEPQGPNQRGVPQPAHA